MAIVNKWLSLVRSPSHVEVSQLLVVHSLSCHGKLSKCVYVVKQVCQVSCVVCTL
jgi:hypothetical protein